MLFPSLAAAAGGVSNEVCGWDCDRLATCPPPPATTSQARKHAAVGRSCTFRPGEGQLPPALREGSRGEGQCASNQVSPGQLGAGLQFECCAGLGWAGLGLGLGLGMQMSHTQGMWGEAPMLHCSTAPVSRVTDECNRWSLALHFVRCSIEAELTCRLGVFFPSCRGEECSVFSIFICKY